MAIPALGDLSRLSHAYLITAPTGEESLRLAETLAAAAVCSDEHPPCGRCRDCRKAAAGIHPDVAVIGRAQDDKGRQKREITVDQVRALTADAPILPNEARRKVYIIDRADTMNIPAQNAALKLLEEPPEWVVFLLCAVNGELLLPTVRSRCVELSHNGQAQPEDQESGKLASAYLKAVAAGDRAGLYAWCAANDGLDPRAAAAFVDCAQAQTADMLCRRREARGLDMARLMALHALLGRCALYLRSNTGVKHIFGLLAVDSIAAEETEDN